MAKQNVEIYFKVDGIEEYITDLEQLDSVLNQVRTATDNVTTATKKMEEQDFEALENRVDALDGSVKVLAGSLEIATGALGALGLENEFFKAVEENAINVIALAEGAINVSEGYKLLAQSGKLAAIQQRILNAVTRANPYVLLATAIIAAGAALAAYTLKTRNAEREQRKANEAKRKAIELANRKARAESDEFKNSAALRTISKLEDEDELQRIINLNQTYVDASERRIAEAEREISNARIVAAVTSEQKAKQTRTINAALKVIEEENKKLEENTAFVEAATERLEELDEKKKKDTELTAEQTAAIEAQTLALKQQAEAQAAILDEQFELTEELYRAGLDQRELAFRDLEDDYYRRLNLANENEELIAQVEAQYEADKAALREQFRQDDLDAVEEYTNAVAEAYINLEDAKANALYAGVALAQAIAGDNEKVQNIIFGVTKAVEAAKIWTGATADIAKTKADTTAKVTALTTSAAAGNLLAAGQIPAVVAAGAAGVTAIKLNAAASLAGIAASSIQQFRGGGKQVEGGGGGGGGVGGGVGASINYQLGAQEEGPTITTGQTSAGQQISQGPIQAYVIATDVTNAQEATAQIENLARL